jgi:membrane protein implicated in regulation of membrane protease activity
MSGTAVVAVCAMAITIMAPGVALAYVGPGAGLSMIGSLIAVGGAVLFAIFGFLILPVRMLLKRRRARVVDGRQAPASEGSTQKG